MNFNLFSVLQMFLSSPKATIRFAAVKTLNRVSADYHNLFILFVDYITQHFYL